MIVAIPGNSRSRKNFLPWWQSALRPPHHNSCPQEPSTNHAKFEYKYHTIQIQIQIRPHSNSCPQEQSTNRAKFKYKYHTLQIQIRLQPHHNSCPQKPSTNHAKIKYKYHTIKREIQIQPHQNSCLQQPNTNNAKFLPNEPYHAELFPNAIKKSWKLLHRTIEYKSCRFFAIGYYNWNISKIPRFGFWLRPLTLVPGGGSVGWVDSCDGEWLARISWHNQRSGWLVGGGWVVGWWADLVWSIVSLLCRSPPHPPSSYYRPCRAWQGVDSAGS